MTKLFHAMLAPQQTIKIGRELDRYLTDDVWAAMEKADGHRVIIAVEDGKVQVFNRSGVPRQHVIPDFMKKSFAKVPFTATFDGELIGSSLLQLFDLPRAINGDTELVGPAHPFSFRFDVLNKFMATWDPHPSIEVLPLAEGEAAKRALLAWTEENEREGIMFRSLAGRYDHGRRSVHLLKHKFRQDGDVVVIDKGVNGKDNLVLGAFDNGTLVEVGHCTALNGDGPKINVGDVIMVNYVHFSSGGRLVQPTRPRLRTLGDKDAKDCTTDQFRRAHGK